MNTANKFLQDSLEKILSVGMRTAQTGLGVRTKYEDGTEAHYISIGPVFVEYDLENGDVPINTLRSFPIIGSINEMRWIYQKQSSLIADAEELNVGWWRAWDIGNGTIGQRYGATVAKYNLMGNLIDTFINDPLSRRKIMSLWQEQDFIDDPKGLKPCAHTTTWDLQIRPDGTHAVTMTLYQRSMDLLVTSSINPFQYCIMGMALMEHLKHKTGKDYKLVKLRHDVGDVHIYDRHVEAALEVLSLAKSKEYINKYVTEEERPTIKIHNSESFKNWGDWTPGSFWITTPDRPKLKAPLELAI